MITWKNGVRLLTAGPIKVMTVIMIIMVKVMMVKVVMIILITYITNITSLKWKYYKMQLLKVYNKERLVHHANYIK